MATVKLSLYLTFHLNLSYSSISEGQRAEVIRKCYWPLLKIAAANTIPLGIEASAYTLECIHHLNPQWIDRFKELCEQKRCEFIGSGYCQIIGPLVPASVNTANLYYGNQLYRKLLDRSPHIALINEQAWSKGILDTYIDHGYDAVIMEWNNPNFLHPNWPAELHYHPHTVLGQSGRPLSLIWNDSIVFQKFQRVIHNEESSKDLIFYLKSHLGESERCLSLYGNDAEIFNFRPGRFATEAVIRDNNEPLAIERLLHRLKNLNWIEFILPSATLHDRFKYDDQSPLTLSTAQVPIPVKKQNKYNAVRWATTGRDDLTLNTYCQQLYEKISAKPLNHPLWKELCYFWSSDFRTHITKARYKSILASLKEVCSKTNNVCSSLSPKLLFVPKKGLDGNWLNVEHHSRHLVITTPTLRMILKTLKGLAIKSLQFNVISEKSLLGTIEHGYFEDMNYAADFFSGHLTSECSGHHQITDLYPVEPVVTVFDTTATITCTIKTSHFEITKTFTLFRDSAKVDFNLNICFQKKPLGTVRLGYITLNPIFFDPKSLFFATHNGGKELEYFLLKKKPIHHFHPISSLISANTCLGITENILHIGDKNTVITLQTDKSLSNCVGGIQYVPMGDTYLLRHIFSAMEHDDTRILAPQGKKQNPYVICFSLSITATKCTPRTLISDDQHI